MKHICLNCHFFAKETPDRSGGAFSFSVSPEERAAVKAGNTDFIASYYSLKCQMGIWDEGVKPGKEDRLERVNKIYRSNTCFFFPYTQGMLFTAALELQKRALNNRQMKRNEAVVVSKKMITKQDLEIFRDLERSIPYNVMKEICSIDFNGSFEKNQLQLLRDFLEYCAKPWHSFDDKDFENIRKEVMKEICKFVNSICEYTFPVDHSPSYRKVPPDWKDDNPEKFDMAIKSLHITANKLFKEYEALMKSLKRAEMLYLEEEKSSKNKGGTMQTIISADVASLWKQIHEDYQYHISKPQFGKRINYVKDVYRREIIFRDVAHAYFCLKSGLYKSAVILAGGVAEELIRLHLVANNHPVRRTFNENLKMCFEKKILKGGVMSYTDGLRDFRNFVHLEKEASKESAMSAATASAAFGTIFTLANGLQ